MTGNGHAIPGTPIAVDMWNTKVHPEAHVFFLSHFHSDHVVGLSSSWEHPIYTSDITAKLIVKKLKIRPYLVRILSIGDEHLIPLDNDQKEMVSVTLFSANHCPGSVIFLFRGYFGNILYTGSFRYSPELVASLKLPVIDVLYLDNTYCSPKCEFSTREDATEAILHRLHECLRASKRVFMGIDSLGKEELLEKIFEETHSKICVSFDRMETLKILGHFDFLTTDSSKAKVIVVLANQITGASLSRWNAEMATCAFLPTARFCGFDMKPYSRHKNIHVIPYSSHSSFKELQMFVRHVHPRCIVPIVGRHVKGTFGVDISERCNMSMFCDFLADSPCPNFTIPLSVQSAMKLWHGDIFPRCRKRLHQDEMVPQTKSKPVTNGFVPENGSLPPESVNSNQLPITENTTVRKTKQLYKIICIKNNKCEVLNID